MKNISIKKVFFPVFDDLFSIQKNSKRNSVTDTNRRLVFDAENKEFIDVEEMIEDKKNTGKSVKKVINGKNYHIL